MKFQDPHLVGLSPLEMGNCPMLSDLVLPQESHLVKEGRLTSTLCLYRPQAVEVGTQQGQFSSLVI